MSPRKSSTSSGRPRVLRPRYLGLEVAGEHLPAGLSPRWWEETLRSALGDTGPARGPLRVVRSEHHRAIVAVDQFRSLAVRAAWNGPVPRAPGARLSTHGTWGTLVGAKAWLRGERPVRPRRRPRRPIVGRGGAGAGSAETDREERELDRERGRG